MNKQLKINIRKILAIFAIIFCIMGSSACFATSNISGEDEVTKIATSSTNKENNLIKDVTKKDSTSEKLVDMKNSAEKSLEQYKIDYGSDSYGFAAYILHMVQIYSIPFCFVGIAVSAIYQYVLGIRKLDTRDKGFNIMIAIVTLFIIAQVLPLIFAIVVKGF